MGSLGTIWIWASTCVAALANDELLSAVAAAARVEVLRKARREVGIVDIKKMFPPGNDADDTERFGRMQASGFFTACGFLLLLYYQ